MIIYILSPLDKEAFLETCLKRGGDAVPRSCFVTRASGSLSAARGRRDTAVEASRRSAPLYLVNEKRTQGGPAPSCTGQRTVSSAGYLTIESDRDARGF